MDLFMQALHAIGVVAAYFILSFGYSALWGYLVSKQSTAEFNEVLLRLGMQPFDALGEKENSLVRRHLAERYSTDFLRNRTSDAAWWLMRILSWLVALLCVGIAGLVAWTSYENHRIDLVPLWTIPALMLCTYLFGLLAAFFCIVVTGRMPGQAMTIRKQLQS